MIPHLAIPFRVTASGSAAVVDQDSFEEIAQCVGVLMSTTAGERIELPDYGIPNPVFQAESEVDTAELAMAIQKWEPRATALVHSTVIDETLRHLLVEIDTTSPTRIGRS
jgi:phage baseplate assembly protein W